ncbi:MAG: amidohydrolase family protein, partial [Sulfurospirillaceae bacterium]|nr:amidohydrolase family protein [Sulfurospirillaceae bacterium]
QALLLGLKEKSIDVLTSAHSPKSILYKDVAFEDAEFGIGGIEEFLPLCYTYLVKEGIIDFEDLMTMCSATPAYLLGLETKGRIGEGFDADIVLFDPNESNLISHKNSLYQGDVLYGKVKKVIVAGVEI